MEELRAFDAVNTPYSKQWVPCQWVLTLLHKAKQNGRVESNIVLLKLVEVQQLMKPHYVNNARLIT